MRRVSIVLVELLLPCQAHGAIENKKFDAETLFKFFALDTYYSLLMKLLAYQVIGFYTLKNVAGLPLTDRKNMTPPYSKRN